ncbi:MAG: sensor histidine kinase [Polyangiales bacterium]
MSIRARLLLIVFLSGAVLAVAIAAIVQLVGSTDSARVEAAESAMESVADAFSDGWSPGDDYRAIERAAAVALLGVPRAAVGLCRNPGVALRLRTRKEGAKPGPLVPEQRSAVEDACAKGKGARAKLRNDTLVIAITGAEGARVWSAVPVKDKDTGVSLLWRIEVGALAAGTLVLVIVSVSAIAALRRGVGDLDRSLDRLQSDLGATIEQPSAEELARIGRGLQRMARHLAEAQERERALSKSLEHEQRLAALGRVAAGVAHEIRNPLAGMKLRLDLMARLPDVPPDLQTDVRACLEEVDRLDRVVRSLLGVARPAEKSVPEEIDLAAMVDERIKLVDAGDVTVKREGEGRVRSDRDPLSRVIDNLLRNAVEASPRGSEVVVKLEPGEKGLTLTVVDHGPGVPEARAAELFEPFFTTKPEGTGLGLFLSRSLVKALGGTLAYDRHEGTTRFSFTLPT